jgi:CheY-like chemotaxis protein
MASFEPRRAGAADRRLRVLLIEDEGLVVALLEDMLADLGHEVTAVASRMPDALARAHGVDFDVAIIDVNLDGEPSYPIAEILRGRGIPFLFATGYGASGLRRDFADATTLAKPFLREDLRRALAAVTPA